MFDLKILYIVFIIILIGLNILRIYQLTTIYGENLLDSIAISLIIYLSMTLILGSLLTIFLIWLITTEFVPLSLLIRVGFDIAFSLNSGYALYKFLFD